MTNQQTLIAHKAAKLAGKIPSQVLEAVAHEIESSADADHYTIQHRVLSNIPQPHFKSTVNAFLITWQYQCSDVHSHAVAVALLTASAAAEVYQKGQQVELVWTGPETHSIPLRRTAQALLQVINAAKKDILIVSFAVYKIDSVANALLEAHGRGVSLRICLESPESGANSISYDTIKALGPDLQEHAEIYVWPLEKRKSSSTGKPGSLHAKLAVADNSELFISSANLTDYAMSLNMEMGVLIRGGRLPGKVRRHFEALIMQRVLVPISAT